MSLSHSAVSAHEYGASSVGCAEGKHTHKHELVFFLVGLMNLHGQTGGSETGLPWALFEHGSRTVSTDLNLPVHTRMVHLLILKFLVHSALSGPSVSCRGESEAGNKALQA